MFNGPEGLNRLEFGFLGESQKLACSCLGVAGVVRRGGRVNT